MGATWYDLGWKDARDGFELSQDERDRMPASDRAEYDQGYKDGTVAP